MMMKDSMIKVAVAGVLFMSWAAFSHAEQNAAKPSYMNPPGLFDASVRDYSQVTVVKSPARFIYLAG